MSIHLFATTHDIEAFALCGQPLPFRSGDHGVFFTGHKARTTCKGCTLLLNLDKELSEESQDFR